MPIMQLLLLLLFLTCFHRTAVLRLQHLTMEKEYGRKRRSEEKHNEEVDAFFFFIRV